MNPYALALLLLPSMAGAQSFEYRKSPKQPVYVVDEDGNPVNVTSEGHLEVGIHDPITAFGELSVAEYTPLIQHHFVYQNSITTENFTFFTNAGASTSTANNMIRCASGGTATSLCSFRTNRSLVYHPGQGSMGRYTARFSSSAAGSILFAGFGNAETALGFTMNELGKFGVVRSSGGVRHTVVLNIGTKSSHVQTATVTLNGTAFYCAVTNGADARVTANEISQCDFKQSYPGWLTEAQGSSVTFIPTIPGALAGSNSIAFSTSGAGSFTTLYAGKNPNVEFVEQNAWNIDTLDGSSSSSNPSGFRIDPTKLNVYQVGFQYLGAGSMLFSIESPAASGAEGEEILPVHRISYAGREVTPSLSNPSMPFVLSARNVGVGANLHIETGSVSAFTQGPHVTLGKQRSYGVSKTGIGTSFVPLLTLNNSRVFGERINQSELDVESVQISNVGTKGAEILIIEDAVLGNDRNWVSVSTNTSPARVDFSATTYQNGVTRISRGVPSGTAIDIDMRRYKVDLYAGDRITILGRSLNTTTDITTSIQWAEDQ